MKADDYFKQIEESIKIDPNRPPFTFDKKLKEAAKRAKRHILQEQMTERDGKTKTRTS